MELRFVNVSDLVAVRNVIKPYADKNKKNMNAMDTYAEIARYASFAGIPDLEANYGWRAEAGFDLDDNLRDNERRTTTIVDASDFIVDIREFDVPYHVRVAIDKGN